MAENKNQHFVPKAHLKAFSVHGEGKAIHLFNLDQSNAFFNAPVKNQCSRNYFYGQDANLESAIQFVEQGYAQCISSLHRPGALVSDLEVTILRRFAYLQHLRTEAAARQSAHFTFAMTKGSDIELPTFKEAMHSGVIAAMMHYAESMKDIDDLKVRIVRNWTSDPFITSDDPSVLANRWYQQNSRARHLSFGFASAGAMLFLPLSPTLLSIIFDGDIYSTESSGGWIDVSNRADVAACNYQQVLNCAANLYFGELDAADYVRSMVLRVSGLRPANRFEVITAVPHEEVLVHLKTVRPIPPKWPSFIKYRDPRFAFTNDTRAGFRRRTTITSSFAGGPPWRKVRV